MARKNLLAGLTQPKLTAVNSDGAVAPTRPAALPFTSRGAVGAVTRSIDDLASKANAAKELEARLISGQVIVELDPGIIDASFVADRMAQDDEDYRALRDSIAQSGQDSPILVRPHPTAAGRFQVAFGHRRLRAATELSKPVRAVVRPLSDRELILAQGQENSARANLSFIERARFAHRLEESGYDRETIMLALSADKTTVSRLITVVERIPASVIDAIGPAPGTGRDRWVELANAFQRGHPPGALDAFLSGEIFLNAASDERFQQVLAQLSDPAPLLPSGGGAGKDRREPARFWAHSSGARVVKIATTARSTVLAIDRGAAPGFDNFLLEQMEELYSRFLADAAQRGRKRTR
ncbi:plasmid partitioning protein RepB [Roseomonas marmotae]|uniref:Plasmid partitioning protein RepB n=1 Tax=Roseomonas marmotae TaxID=2768161 RepID=A0ABS3KB56_9PROT|nr:plasmid partitioning protein RepB [Roseomonas marmotae]MBO1074701.1 plasmid partitioning protein RepB [Roseomonas marmotae]QTI81356.1 plasmid partitioning protein RepB [Roseomonas marmotae]